MWFLIILTTHPMNKEFYNFVVELKYESIYHGLSPNIIAICYQDVSIKTQPSIKELCNMCKYNKNLEHVEKLIEKGVNFEVCIEKNAIGGFNKNKQNKDLYYATPLRYSILSANNICNVLINNIKEINVYGNDILLIAIKNKIKYDDFVLLADLYFSDNDNDKLYYQDIDGNTLLHYAVDIESFEIFRYVFDCVLLKNDVIFKLITIKNNTGFTSFNLACKKKQRFVIDRFLNVKLNDTYLINLLQTCDNDLNTPLHHSASNNDLYTVKLLLQYGASNFVLNKNELMPSELTSNVNIERILSK